MARTLVGILQILLKQDVTAKAPEINRALASIQGAATRLGNTPWGAGFDRQLERLKLSPAERAAIAGSYGLLARDINGKIGRADLASWRNGVLGHFTAVRAGMDEANASAKRFHTTMGKMVRMGLITFGGVGGLYLGSRALHGGASAASEEWRQQAEARYSGLPEGEREALWNQSVKLAGERRLNTSLMFQTLREAALAMETTADAIEVSDGMAQALLYLSNTLGADGAVNGLRAFNKAMDNIQNITPDEYLKSLEAYIRAQQMTGADMDPEAFAQAIKYSRSAGKMFSDDYLFNWLPFSIAEVGGSDAGTQLRAFADNTIGGTASKKVKDYQTEIGVRGADGNMAFGDELLANPERWVNDRLVPALQAAGVDTNDNVQLSQVLNNVASNRLARDFILRAITNWEQKQRLTNQLPRTAGLAAADDIQSVNPFATLDGLVDSLENLSGAAGGHIFPVIIPAMNSLADTINSVAAQVREMPSAAFGLGLGALGLGGVGAWKVGAGIVSLATAGPSLQTAATMLQGAATSLNGGAAPGGQPGSKNGWQSAMAFFSWATAGAVALDYGVNAAGLHEPVHNTTGTTGALNLGDRIATKLGTMFAGPTGAVDPLPSPYENLRAGGINWGLDADATSVDTHDLDQAGTVADTTTSKLAALNATLKPVVDLTNLNALVALLRTAISLQGQLGVATGGGLGVQGQINSSFADFGVAP